MKTIDCAMAAALHLTEAESSRSASPVGEFLGRRRRAKRKKGSKLHLVVSIGSASGAACHARQHRRSSGIGRIAKTIQAETGQSVEVSFVDQATQATNLQRRLQTRHCP